MKHLLLLSLLILSSTIIQADVFQCKDQYGKLVFKDSECGSSNSVIRPDLKDNASKVEPSEIKELQNTVIDDGKPGKLIYLNKKRLSPPYSIKVNEVRVITETDDMLVVDVIYTYKHKIPANEIRIFVTPDHPYWAVNHIQAEEGLNVGRARIGLSQSNMKKKWVTRSSTKTISVRFEHYPPDNTYKGIIWSETIKYKKNWKLK